ncbi:MAG: hypothetical protein IT363_01990 [Methanoregulaceae archaeon]|nr:hypothetical protein [Methanoregulaceae archaeon]
MPITITRTRVKEKCNISVTTYDATIDNLIAEFTPVIETTLQSAALDDSGLSATLTLGATEVVCGELLAQLRRQENALPPTAEACGCGGFDPTDPSRLARRGWSRLRPYLLVDWPFRVATGVRTGATFKPVEEPL